MKRNQPMEWLAILIRAFVYASRCVIERVQGCLFLSGHHWVTCWPEFSPFAAVILQVRGCMSK